MGPKQKPLPVCFLCLKRIGCVSPANDAENNANKKVKFFSNKFLVFTHTYLNIPVKEFSYDIKNSSCHECRDSVNLICHLYDELCSTQLKLSKELNQLADLLEYSKKRISDKMIKAVMTALADQMSQEDERDHYASLEEVDKMRVLLTEKCRLCSHPSFKPNTPTLSESSGVQNDSTPDIKEETRSLIDEDEYDELQMDSDDNDYPNDEELIADKVSTASSQRAIHIQVIHNRNKATSSDSDSNRKDDSTPKDKEYTSLLEKSTNDSSDSEQEGVKTSRKKTLSSSGKTKLSTCDQCHKTYRNRGALTKHKLHVHGIKMSKEAKCLVSCDQCDKKFTTKWAMIAHKQRFHNAAPPEPSVKPYSCDMCPAKFKHRFSIHTHMKIVHHVTNFSILGKDKPYKCEICGRGSTTEYGRVRHKMTVHGINEKKKLVGNKKSTKEKKQEIAGPRQGLRKTTPLEPSAKPYSCDLCTVNFKHKYSIHSHMKVVHGVTGFSLLGKNKPYTCEICGNGSTTEYGRIRHKLTVHGIKEENKSVSLKCSECTMEFVTRRQHVHHMYEIHKKTNKSISFLKRVADSKGNTVDDANETCVVCGLEFKSWILLKEHLDVHESQIPEENKSKMCYFCSYSFANEQTVWAHLRCSQNHDFTKVEFPCDHPDHLGFPQWVYENPCQLEEHFKKEHNGDSIHRCVDCGWPFLDKYMLDLHRILHLSKVNGKHQCPICGKFSLNEDSFREHYNTVHGNSLKVYRCPTCTLGFSAKNGFALHIKIHEGNAAEEGKQRNQFFCSECPKRYSTAIQLKHHKRTIHATRQCQECGLIMQASKLSRHRRMVHGTEEHMCTICGKAYKQITSLKIHMSSHGQYRFTCQFCGSGSRSAGHLRRHISRMHKDKLTDQRPTLEQEDGNEMNISDAANI